MNILNKVTLKTLGKNRVRTLVTIIGIILSAAMLTAVTTFISSLQNYAYETAVYKHGDWHGAVLSVDSQKLTSLKSSDEVSNISSLQNIGYARLEDSKNEYKPYLFVGGASKDFIKNMPLHLSAGRLPKTQHEIILPDHLQNNGGVRIPLNSTVSFELGSRTMDGQTLTQGNALQYFEKKLLESFQPSEKRTYTVVGIYKRPDFEKRSAPGYTAITLMDESPAAGYSYDAYLKLHHPDETFDFLEKQGKDTVISTNKNVLMYLGLSNKDAFGQVLYSLGAILIVLIIFGSVSLIYNAFSISVSERTKQFGLLSSIGATKKQIRKSVIFEAFFVSLIGIPIGIACGVGGIGVTLALLGQKFNSILYYDADINLSMHVSVISIVISAMLALLTVLISAFIPSKRATKISAIEAIRQSSDITIKSKAVKTSRLTYKLFGLEGLLAKKHFKRNRKKYRATVVSLFMSIVLFVAASAFTSYLKMGVSGATAPKDYNISYYKESKPTEKEDVNALFNTLSNVEGTGKTNHISIYSLTTRFDKSALTKDFMTYRGNDTEHSFIVVGVKDSVFEEYLDKNKLDKSLYMNTKKPLGILKSHVSYFDPNEGKIINFEMINKKAKHLTGYTAKKNYEELSNEDREKIDALDYKHKSEYFDKYDFSVGTSTDHLALGVDYVDEASVILMYSQSVLENAFKTLTERTETTSHMFFFEAKNYEEVNPKLQEILITQGESTSNIINWGDTQSTSKNLVLIMDVFSTGFIVLISLIATANVFNTISTNISLRRREFAMLKSVGMTRRGFNKMMNFECILYGMKALLWGIPVSILVTFLIFFSINQGYMTAFTLPLVPIAIAALSVFLVVFSTMIYAMGKIKKDNPIDALKNENL